MAANKSKGGTKYGGVLAERMVREFLMQAAGENALAVAGEIVEPMSDEDLARVCKLKVSEVRSVLNKLHAQGIASYERTRDKESGWYSYTWAVDLQKIPEILEGKKTEELKKLEQILENEKTIDFYVCKKCRGQRRYTFEEASEFLFKCVKCSRILALHDNKKDIEKLEKKTQQLQSSGM